ncbi:MAG: sigma-54-dependent Fis family transcriptional regulator [Lentisphaeria bacterium]|nr:sigma-54-dependent Fis family transcriptional regulator [Lentisphaeria bacterium]
MSAGSKPRVLVIDDERRTREGLEKALRPKYDVLLAEDAVRGLEILGETTVDVIVTDLRMPKMDGMAFTREVAAGANGPIVIMLTAFGSVQTAIDAMKVGAYDYLTKPINLDNLEMVIDRGIESRRLRRENERLRLELDRRHGFDGIIGNSKAMQDVFDTVRQVAEARSTVLLTGESGTGKELFAKAIHQLSARRNKPFVVVHCAALNENLLESELFGHEKGAFTSAHERNIGRFEKADGGTLFLDEIGEIDAATQVKLLRVLETRTFERVGGSKQIETDIRLITATNRDLKAMVAAGTFREDLYFRINVINVVLPPLRERIEDIPLLLNHFRSVGARENGKEVEGFTSEAVKMLCVHRWPGNIRELRNCVERMVVMARGPTLTVKDVPTDIRNAIGDDLVGKTATPTLADEPAPNLDMDAQERNLIVKALREADGNRTRAAELLGISRRTLHRKLHTYQLEDM